MAREIIFEYPQLVDKDAMEHKRRWHAAFKNNLSDFSAYHREKAMAAVQNKKNCHNCDAENCNKKCMKCKSVAYCGKTCQVTDWPRHKRVCKIFQHVVNTFQSMSASSVANNPMMGSGTSEAFCVILLMAGIEADLLQCVCSDHDGTKKICPVVLAEGRIYDIAIMFYKDIYPDLTNRNIQPLPPDSEIRASLLMEISLIDAQNSAVSHSLYQPWIAPANIDYDDHQLIVRHLCRAVIEQIYLMTNHKTIVISLFNEFKTIKKATGESAEDFKTRLDGMLNTFGPFDPRSCWHEKYIHAILCNLPLKAETRTKLKWCNGEEAERFNNAMEELMKSCPHRH